MIVVDTSALVALLRNEPEAKHFKRIVREAGQVMIAAPTKLELMLVCGGKDGAAGIQDARRLLMMLRCRVEDFTNELADPAADAFLEFGKGQHPAKLNFGDCMSYALAKSLGALLLYKGEDFAQTDVLAAA